MATMDEPQDMTDKDGMAMPADMSDMDAKRRKAQSMMEPDESAEL